ncbi:Periplasmic pH-dependent serine endoprotease DegQ precursor [Corynebacterium ciconiae DSM 44920]|uniref:S1C family serine protease n=1 Tax=Corynebacterium ciconiae TaxID=227319 RepID=UPI00037E0DCD|nr:trypsin-like peptidase domain-containing protein [Corynebacterium ciconiae]WKD61656.1 Periplasmic pH-dependent serine endoprotease DegQ precursor [Corynebacterium ciconiae DSM 44920]
MNDDNNTYRPSENPSWGQNNGQPTGDSSAAQSGAQSGWHTPSANPYDRWQNQPTQEFGPNVGPSQQPAQPQPGPQQPQSQPQPQPHLGPQQPQPQQASGAMWNNPAAGNQQQPPQPQPGAAEAGSVAGHAPQHEKPKRQVGFVTAMAMMLVGAVAAGSITGLVVANSGSASSPRSDHVNALAEQPVDRTGDAEEGSVEDVASRVLPAVVSIATERAEGSGSVISDDGLILTNNHVVAGSEKSPIVVTMHDGKHYRADFVAGDSDTDVAVIKLRDAHDLTVMTFGNSDDLKVGQNVVAVGSPLGLEATVTSGIVSALNRPIRAAGHSANESSLIDAIQTDAAINPGNSGGPLVDMQGNLVGMNSVIATTSAGGSDTAGSIGVGFAIPSNQARRLADQLVKTGEVKQPIIGARVAANGSPYGAVVASVEPGSPAEQAGVKAGDIISRVNDRSIDSADALITAVRSQEFGATISLEIVDDNGENPRTVEVTLPNE